MTDYNQVPQPQQPYGAPAPANDIPAPAGAYYGAPSAQTAAGGVQLDAYGNPIVAASAPAVATTPTLTPLSRATALTRRLPRPSPARLARCSTLVSSSPLP